METRKDVLEQKKLREGLFELRYKGRVFLMRTYPIRIVEVDSFTDDDVLNEEVEALLYGSSEDSNELQPTFSGFGAVEFIATTHCNLRCTHCTARDFDESGSATYYGIPAKHMSLETMIRAIETGIEQLESRQKEHHVPTPVFEMFITGGEPMLVWDDLKRAFSYARKRLSCMKGVEMCEFVPHIVTNGTLIDEQVAKEMVEEETHVTVALDSPFNQVRVDSKNNPATPEAIVGVKNLVKAGHPQTSVNVVIAGEDMDKLESVMEYLEMYSAFEGITTIQLSPLAPPISHTQFAAKGLTQKATGFTNPSICENFSDKLIEYSGRYNLDMKGYGKKLGSWLVQGGTTHRCPVAEWKWAVTPEGDVYACHQLVGIEQFKMGNVHKDNWYESKDSLAIRDRFLSRTANSADLCSECALQSTCMVFVDCPARSFLEMGDENTVVPHYCSCGKKYLEQLLGEHVVGLVDKGRVRDKPLC